MSDLTPEQQLVERVVHELMALPEFRFYRLVVEWEETTRLSLRRYMLACGHEIMLAPAYPDGTLKYLPCPECWRLWDCETTP